MMKSIESLDLSVDMGIDNLYYLFETTSSTINLELLSKIKRFSNSKDFFNHYANNDINLLLNFLIKLEDNYLSICNNDNYLNISSNIEQYISIISNLIILYNLILQNKKIIKKIIMKTKDNLIKNYSNNLIVDYQNKINEYLNNLLNLSFNDEKIKNNYPRLYTQESISTANITISTDSSINSILKDKMYNEDKIKNDFCDINEEDIITPYFVTKGEYTSQKSLINNIEITSNNNNFNFIIYRKDSVDSIFNLPCVNISSDKNIPNITGNKNLFLINNESNNNSNIKNIKNKNILNNIKSYNNKNTNKHKKCENEKDLNKIKRTDKSNNSNMYKVILKNINEIYKKGEINSFQKIKLKQLIISKSPIIQNLYYYYCNNNINEYIEEIKKIL